MFKQLPLDVIFKVLDNLTINETEQLIDTLNQIHHVTDMDRKFITELVIISYQRIYRGRFTIYSNLDSHNPSRFDKAMTFEDFQNKVLSPELHGNKWNGNPNDRYDLNDVCEYDDNDNDNDNEANPKQNRMQVENFTFKHTRSQYVEFVFIRQPNDYRQFVRDLNDFSRMIETKETNLFKYLNSVLQFGLYINGNCVAIEPTTSFLVSILKLLIAISSEEIFNTKFTRITIKSTDIGHYYITQWCKLFSRFTNTEYLDLSDNLIKLDENAYEFTPSAEQDLLGTNFEFPPNLKYLNLNANFIGYVSRKFIENLPESLEVLILSNNWLTTLGHHQEETFELLQLLPNLKVLSLSYNNRLVYINPEMFQTPESSSPPSFKTLSVKGCNITSDNLTTLGAVAKRNSFIIEI